MDVSKTGALIAALRRERGLTQKQLAETLHISDRTVSKWERGAGFPDVSLLSPLADSLDISVAALLEGEPDPDADPEVSLRNAVSIVYKQTKAKVLKNFVQIIARVIVSLFCLGFIYAALEYNGVFLKNVSLETPVYVYKDAQAVESSMVRISGRRSKHGFSGTFAIECVEKTTRPEVRGNVSWGAAPREGKLTRYYDKIRFWGYGGPFDCGIDSVCYISSDMRRMAMKLDDGTVIATDDELMQLIMLSAYYPLDF